MQQIIQIIISHLPDAKIIVFGSQVSGRSTRYSDIDIAIDNGVELSLFELSKIKEQFSLSDIPILVDICDYYALSEDFKKQIQDSAIVIKK
ncbi:MAG: nucleotidyltransferase domain-containing protein [Oligoflexia bacterium]|nr:nucleotidyltransferase domain-containing protein [Oligoflexia bacterium]